MRRTPKWIEAATNTVDVTIPLHISIRLGKPMGAPPAMAPRRSARGERRRVGNAAITESTAAAEGLFAAPVPTVPMNRFRLASLRAAHFDWNSALSLALASLLSYRAEAEVKTTAVGTFGFQQCEFISVDDTQAFIAWTGDLVLIAFRGTESIGDWLIDLNILSSTRPYGVVHRGFLGAFQVVEQRLRQLLGGLAGRRLLLTGHSLGGALATVAAAELPSTFKAAAIYTYGQPAVGKGDFTSFFSHNFAGAFHRFVNDDDIVPQVPPTFAHVGNLIHFDANGNIQSGSVLMSAVAEAVGVPPPQGPMLTKEEFDALRTTLLQERTQSTTESVDAEQALAESALAEGPIPEGFFPSVSDHKMDKYLAKIVRNTPNP